MIIGLIPARSGSKGIQNKNITPLGGHPLMAWSIVASVNCKLINRTIVTTDSEEYGKIASEYGASVLMRPPHLAADSSPDYDYLNHAKEHMPDANLFVLLRPTTPFRVPSVINDAIKLFLETVEYTSARSVEELSEPAEKMLWVRDNTLVGMWTKNGYLSVDDANKPRQSFEKAYKPNGYIDIVCPSIIKEGKVFGKRVIPLVTYPVIEIDRSVDLEYAQWALDKYGSPLSECLSGITAART